MAQKSDISFRGKSNSDWIRQQVKGLFSGTMPLLYTVTPKAEDRNCEKRQNKTAN
ncbi:hypothetical protein VCRA2128O102_390035 [Vibrio crassostreae]|nr:hypothetical protein VCRA2127O91_410035 [Vibrio crassostreae]CAK3406309.1 hypothetical protein VCRA2128O102_390035 [Vibrio crassostreae]CAK3606104.1 hypothetical protein VCRA2128O108_410035 [Vibrio crassostreae]CAK3932504.1 hypothetical protein VCRA2128O93_400035 [Vibrio crassostreae]